MQVSVARLVSLGVTQSGAQFVLGFFQTCLVRPRLSPADMPVQTSARRSTREWRHWWKLADMKGPQSWRTHKDAAHLGYV